MQQQEILNEYKKYNYLNREKNNPFIKILVSYIKPSFLFKSNILTPIHLGKAVEKEISKDGIQNDENLEWLHKNCVFNDDFDGGISEYNRRIGFLTGTYWAWKNYEKLGNPEYFGSFGYRRVFKPDFLIDIKKYDLILPKALHFTCSSIKKQMIMFHGTPLLNYMLAVFDKVYPNEKSNLLNYFDGENGYFWELYIMKKNIFFDFCAWIFPLLFEYLKFDSIQLSDKDERDIGFIMERLTGYYCYKLVQNNLLKIKHTDMILTEKVSVNEKTREFMIKNIREKLKRR